MKKLYFIIVIMAVFSVQSVSAKNVRMKNERVSTFSFKYPSITLPEVTSYDFQIIVPYSLQMNPPSVYLASSVQITGWNRDVEQPSIMMTLMMDEPRISPIQLLSRYEVKKDSVKNRKGEMVLCTDTTYFYSYRIELQGRGRMETTDRKGQVIANDDTRNFCTERKSREYQSRRQAHHDMMMNADAFRMDMLQEYYNNQVNQCSAIANSSYSFYEHPTYVTLKNIANKKHPEYANFNSHVKQVEMILNQYRPTRNKEITAQKLQNYIDYFHQVTQKYQSDKRSARIMRYMAAQNMAVIYQTLEQYQSINTVTPVWYASGIKTQDANRLLSWVASSSQLRALNDWDF